jgi:hypothetical protein
MAIILQFSLCLYELKWLVINVDDHFLSQNIILPLSTYLHNGLHLIVIGGISMNNTR